MAAESAKRTRSAAKGRLTRTINALNEYVRSDGIEQDLLNSIFCDVERTWRNLEQKHDEFISVVEDPENDDYEEWMRRCQDDFYKARTLYYVTKKDVEQKEEVKRLTRLRDVKFDNLRHSIKKIEDSIATKCTPDSVRREMLSISRQFDEVKQLHSDVACHTKDDMSLSGNWLDEVAASYSDISYKVDIYINEVESKKNVKPTSLQLKKMPLPKFDGDVRKYARFEKDFVELVKPTLVGSEGTFILRQCLSPEVCQVVQNCDDVDSMIKRLNERFGDPSKLVDIIVSEILKFKHIEVNDDKKLIEFIHVIEAGYRDLKCLKLEREISNANIVSIIENKLPRNVALEWFREIHKKDSMVEKTDKFPHLLEFLCVERRSVEYGLSELRMSHEKQSAKVNLLDYSEKKEETLSCLIHGRGAHKTADCEQYVKLSVNQRYSKVRENSACFKCLGAGHFVTDCKEKEGCFKNCKRLHHKSLHWEENVTKESNLAEDGKWNEASSCVLQIMRIKVAVGEANFLNVLWDGGSTVSLITNDKAKLFGLRGVPVKLKLTTCGGEERDVGSYRYTIPLVDANGCKHNVTAYGIERITNDISRVDCGKVVHLFKNLTREEIDRPVGSVDLLIGMEYAAWHPQQEQGNSHLLVLANQFGRCLGGSHYLLHEKTRKGVHQVTVNNVSLSRFLEIESMGIETNPLCGNCRCGKCPIGGKNYTIKEERELALIKKNMTFNGDHWIVKYPWLRTPLDLPDNRIVALKRLMQTERRLARDKGWSDVYCQQMDDMVSRKVARRLTREEMETYEGPVHYISHHAVVNESSKTTPVRIVFNSSASYQGHSLNDYWAKGPNAFMNPLLGILLRFRENPIAMVADIRKMYNSVMISILDQHCHRYLWRNMDAERDPETYVITAVNIGDKPGGAIATVALRETAEMFKVESPRAAKIIQDSTYVDDVIDSVEDEAAARNLAVQISSILKKGNFHLKGWTLSGGVLLSGDGEEMKKDSRESIEISGVQELEKVLGMRWEPREDLFKFEISLNFVKKSNYRSGRDVEVEEIPSSFTKRMLISFVNGIYDPMGLVAPIITRGKMIVRKAWAHEPKTGWDDPLPEYINQDCVAFVKDMMQVQGLSFNRCVKPERAVGDPILITFSDASKEIFGACCYLRWRTVEGSYVSKLLLGKSRAAPLKVMTIVRLELSAAVLATRIRKYVLKEGRLKFSRFVHIVDSEIVRTMIQKESYGYNTFTATRVGEIQQNSDPSEWYWISGKENVADVITRGAKPSEVERDTCWQNGPEFLKKDFEEWPIMQVCYTKELPERTEICLTAAKSTEEAEPIIEISRFSKYLRLVYTTARILSVKQEGCCSLQNIGKDVSKEKLGEAVQFWVAESQKEIKDDLLKAVDGKGRFRKLCPAIRDDGIFVVGGRAVRWTEVSYNKEMIPILPRKHRFAMLFARYIHDRAHLGVDADVAKIRASYWIIGLTNVVKGMREKCVTCRKKYMKLAEQRMGRLPIERLKPAPPWYHVMIDLFGPFTIKGEVNKRSSMKVYGVIITDLLTRAVHVDISPDYSTDAFLLVFRKFVAIRGYPAVMFSDQGTQLTGASSELKLVMEGWDWKRVKEFGVSKGLEWRFSPPDSPWWNGCVEALVRSVKKAMYHAIGEHRLSFSELQAVCYEAANIVNERPVGIKPSECSDSAYLSPNDLLLGRSTNEVPEGNFDKGSNLSKRYILVQSLAESFWKKWITSYFPSLLIQQKWHQTKRNVMVGDIVVISEKNLSRNSWRIGRVSEAITGIDGIVRRIKIEYRNNDNKEMTTIERSVQRVNVILPVDADGD